MHPRGRAPRRSVATRAAALGTIFRESRFSVANLATPTKRDARFSQTEGNDMARMENGHIVETATEARGAERGPMVRNVLVAGTGLVIAGFIIVYLAYFAA
jgi:hypothetical protein